MFRCEIVFDSYKTNYIHTRLRNDSLKVWLILTCYCRRTYYHGATVSEYRERHQEFPITVGLPITMVLLFQSIVNDIKNSLLL